MERSGPVGRRHQTDWSASPLRPAREPPRRTRAIAGTTSRGRRGDVTNAPSWVVRLGTRPYRRRSRRAGDCSRPLKLTRRGRRPPRRSALTSSGAQERRSHQRLLRYRRWCSPAGLAVAVHVAARVSRPSRSRPAAGPILLLHINSLFSSRPSISGATIVGTHCGQGHRIRRPRLRSRVAAAISHAPAGARHVAVDHGDARAPSCNARVRDRPRAGRSGQTLASLSAAPLFHVAKRSRTAE
jgi:hypothetical protein